MDCDALHQALIDGGPAPGDAEAAAHLAGCVGCRELVADVAALSTERRAAEAAWGTLDPAAADALRRDLARRLGQERGPLAWLRSRPTWLRRAALLGLAGALVAAVVASLGPLGLRRDVAGYPPLRLALEAGLLATVAAAALWTAVRPLHRPALPTWGAALLVAAGVALPALLALPPEAATALRDAPGGLGGSCFLNGAKYALPLVVLLGLLARCPDLTRTLLAAVGAALTGVLVLQLHCPAVERTHLLIGHGTLGLAFAIAALVLGLVRRQRA